MFDLKKIPGSRDLYFFILPVLRKQLEARFFFRVQNCFSFDDCRLEIFLSALAGKKDGKEELGLREVFKNLVLEELDLVR